MLSSLMPQMAPLLWSYLFIFSYSVLLMFTTFNYFIKTPVKITPTLKTTSNPQLTWKL